MDVINRLAVGSLQSKGGRRGEGRKMEGEGTKALNTADDHHQAGAAAAAESMIGHLEIWSGMGLCSFTLLL